MEETFRSALEASPDEFLYMAARNSSRPNKTALKLAVYKCSKKAAGDLCGALARFAELQVRAFQNLDSDVQFEPVDSFKTPSPKRKRRKCVSEKPANPTSVSAVNQPTPINVRRTMVFSNLKACALVANLGLSHPTKAFQPCDLFPTVQILHDQLVFFEEDIDLQDAIASLCETWWKDHLPGKESLIAQSLPYLLSKSLEAGRKIHVHRLYVVREAFTLFDFEDESIGDLKHLLMRCVLTPAYLRSSDGRRFISFLFGVNAQLTKELIMMVRSQIPFGRKSILEAYGEILYRAWRTTSGPCLHEIQESCLQGLIEGAVYASTKTLASSIRKILAEFTSQRTQDGVEALLFRLQEPVLFRSLQVANSNVRRNALLLLIDMFPLVNPDALKEENDILLEKQFVFLEKLLSDPCPDVRTTAVEGVCRVLRLFWEVVSSTITVKLLSKIVDETAQDNSNTAVRCAVLQGMAYLLENPASHELSKVLLPRLAPLLSDCNLTVRIAMVDLLLMVKGIRAIPLLKVVELDSLLSALAADKPPVVRRLTRLLIPSYFPSKVPLAEACNRCIALIKRSPKAGVRFCQYALAEGAPSPSLFELVRVFISLLSSSNGLDTQGQEGIFSALSNLCQSLACQKEFKLMLGEILTRETLKSLLSNAATSSSCTSIVQLVSAITPKDLPELFDYCAQFVTNLTSETLRSITCNEVRAVHTLMLSWGGFNDLIQALVGNLNFDSQQTGKHSRSESKSCKTPWTKSMKKTSASGKSKSSNEAQTTDKLISAVGAAWHVENLIEMDEARKTLLEHESLPSVVSGLRNMAHCVMCNSLDLPVSDFLKASPVRAYAAISIHKTLKEKGLQRAASSTMSDQKDTVSEVCEELIEWTLGLQQHSSVPKNPVANVKSAGKRSRSRSCRPRCREPFTDISNTPSGATFKCPLEPEKILSSMRLSNTSLESLLYFISLKLVKSNTVQDACLKLASKQVQGIIDWLKAWNETQMEHWKKEAGITSREIQLCIKNLASHAAKMLYLSLRNDTERALQFADLAHHVLDLVVQSDSLLGLKGAMSLLTAIKPWVPDLLIGISSTAASLIADQGKESTSHFSFDELVDLGKRTSRTWVTSFATAAFRSFEQSKTLSNMASPMQEGNSQEPGESSQSKSDEVHKSDQGLSFSLRFLNKVCKLVRRGDSTVLESILDLFLWHGAFTLSNRDYRSAAGAMDIVCKRLLNCKQSVRRATRIVLSRASISACESIDGHLDADTSSSLCLTMKELLNSILSTYGELS